jgi:PiT family inorganic phosphate transporter
LVQSRKEGGLPSGVVIVIAFIVLAPLLGAFILFHSDLDVEWLQEKIFQSCLPSFNYIYYSLFILKWYFYKDIETTFVSILECCI